MKKPNLLVIGASGAVASAFLQRLARHRNLIGKLILLDRSRNILKHRYIDHKALDYVFLHKEITLPKGEKEYHGILKKYDINIAIDLSTMPTTPLFESTDRLGVSYLGTSANDSGRTIYATLFEILSKRGRYKNAVHIHCSGMNPGIVNMWVRIGIEEYGVPESIVHFEYDTSTPAKGWRPIMTWSIKEFIEEVVDDPSAIMLGGLKVKEAKTNSLMNRVNMKEILKPIIDLDKYPCGFTVPHEECATIAYKYKIPSKYIYAFNMDTMDRLVKRYREKGKITSEDLIFNDNTKTALEGSDSIGVLLNYKDKAVCFFNSISNQILVGTNATCTQVAIGVFAGLFTLMFDKQNLKPGLYFPEDLYGTYYKYFMADNMKIQKYVFQSTDDGLKLVEYVPQIRLENKKLSKRLYIF